MFADHSAETAALVRARAAAALEELGPRAVEAVREQMARGYSRPILDSGALMEDVRWQREGLRLTVGNTLPYAGRVHDGTRSTPARPYLRDALEEQAPSMLAEALEGGI